ncbi:class A beta-lactamase [Novosphingobium sp. FKTRR1]|uniref:class A beta-lactamase n=1 Tax=Novosphingobium sp. FKTRR1 TaxID=2879118 RepID=UPI001CF04A29|nr:class A beta-lactamase [Novosphingobium sp. FKTRR1]
MTSARHAFTVVLAGALALLASDTAMAGVDADPVTSDIAALAKTGAGSTGVVGVAAWRLDGTGPSVLLNPDARFPMASTFKVAVAGAVLKRVDDGSVSLDRMIPITLDEMVDSEVIQDRFIHPGVSLSVYNLLELMLTESDNTATDVMLRLAGGPAAVNAWVRAQGVDAFSVDGGTDEIIRRYYGVSADAGPFHQAMVAKFAAHPELARLDNGPNPAFDNDLRDSTSPRAMGHLLTRIWSGAALLPASNKILIAMMGRCRTGAGRLRGQMPADSPVAHKTGTIGGTVNDVGVVTLPGKAGQVVLAVFIKGSDATMDQREQTIAQIGRSVRDYFLFRNADTRP